MPYRLFQCIARTLRQPRARVRRAVPFRLWCLPALTLLLLGGGAASHRAAHPAAQPLWPSGVLVEPRRTEPSLAINPRNPFNVIAAANPTYRLNRARHFPATYFASFDGGQTWQAADLPMPAPYGTGADTGVAFDRYGVAYLSLMAEDYRRFCRVTRGAVALLVTRSRDGGQTVTPPVIVDTSPGGEDDDKPAIAVGTVPATLTRPAHTAVYLTWTRWGSRGGSRIMFARSDDGGRTFGRPQQLFASRESNMGAQPAVGPDGTLYVAWARYTSGFLRTPVLLHVMVAISADGGRTFAAPVALDASWSLPQMLPPGLLRVYTMPSIVVDQLTGAVYVAWPRARVGLPVSFATVDADIVLSRSRDHGATWSTPVALNDVAWGDRFMPALAVLPGGMVAAVFYDRRGDHRAFDVYAAAARDDGTTLALFPNLRLTARASPAEDVPYYKRVGTCVDPGRFLGDYIALAADAPSATVAAAWADSQSRIPKQTDLRFARLPLSRLQAGPSRTVLLQAMPGNDAVPQPTPTPAVR